MINHDSTRACSVSRNRRLWIVWTEEFLSNMFQLDCKNGLSATRSPILSHRHKMWIENFARTNWYYFGELNCALLHLCSFDLIARATNQLSVKLQHRCSVIMVDELSRRQFTRWYSDIWSLMKLLHWNRSWMSFMKHNSCYLPYSRNFVSHQHAQTVRFSPPHPKR